MEETKFEIPSPPKQIFQTEIGSGRELIAFEDDHVIPIINRIDYPETGGIFVYWKGYLYPHKGFPFPEAVFAVSIVKRMIVSAFKFISLIFPIALVVFLGPLRRRFMTHALKHFTEVADVALGPYYLKDRYWMKPARELDLLITQFFKYLGIETTIGRVLAMTIEYDTAYCCRFQDIMSETDWVKLQNPIKEISRLLGLFCKREPDPLIREKFKKIIRLVKLVLYIPKVNSAFKKAVRDVNIENFWFTEADEYHILPLSGYDFGGLPVLERLETFMNIHKNKGVPIPSHRYKTMRPKTDDKIKGDFSPKGD